MKVLVTGGAGYVGLCVVEELVAAGHDARVLDVLLHGQDRLAAGLEENGIQVIRADIRDAEARRRALEDRDAVVHLAAIVGDPACALDPPLSHAVNVEGSRALARRRDRTPACAASCSRPPARTTGVCRTRPCPDRRGRRARPGVPLCRAEGGDREGAARRRPARGPAPTCLRSRDRLRRGSADALRPHGERVHARPVGPLPPLEVFGERFWRPYVHARGRGSRRRHGARRRARASWRAGVQRGHTRTRTTGSWTSSRSSPAQLGRGDVKLRPPRRGSTGLQGELREGQG